LSTSQIASTGQQRKKTCGFRLKNPEQQHREHCRKNRRGEYVHPPGQAYSRVFLFNLFFLYLSLDIAIAPTTPPGRSGITARGTAVTKEGFFPYKTAIGTADGREKPPAIWAAFCVLRYLRAAIITEKTGNDGDGGSFFSFRHFFCRPN